MAYVDEKGKRGGEGELCIEHACPHGNIEHLAAIEVSMNPNTLKRIVCGFVPQLYTCASNLIEKLVYFEKDMSKYRISRLKGLGFYLGLGFRVITLQHGTKVLGTTCPPLNSSEPIKKPINKCINAKKQS